jgi:predicted Zn finger-like uncharacterized protein
VETEQGVKFLCDRCKTRYSIGDDRVRGKILKIRCKNCANVITVREGMMVDPDAAPVAPEYPGRAKKATTSAPEALHEAAESPRGAKDPARTDRSRASSPAGDRARTPAGARQPAGTVRHAVGAPEPAHARRTALALAPAEDARRGQAGVAKRTTTDSRRHEPSNALGAAFASAMAKPPPALEEEWYVSIDGDQAGPFSLADAQQWVAHKPFDAELHCWSEGFDDWLPVDKVSHFRGLRKRSPSTAVPPPLPRVAGVPHRAVVAAPVEDEPKPLFAATMASLERGAPAMSGPGLSLPPAATPLARTTPPFDTAIEQRTNGTPGVLGVPGAPGAPGASGAPSAPVGPGTARAGAEPFPGDAGESQTDIAPAPFRDPILVPRRDAAPGSATAPPPPASSTFDTGANPTTVAAVAGAARSQFASHDDNELAIGEVSRVVNLADISRPPRPGDRPGTARRAGPGPAFRATTVGPSLPSDASADGVFAAPGEADPGATMAPVRGLHRRGLITLLSVAGVMVLGVIGAVILLVTTDDDQAGGKLGPVLDIDTSRPEDPITHRPIDLIAPPHPAPPNPFVPRRTRG